MTKTKKCSDVLHEVLSDRRSEKITKHENGQRAFTVSWHTTANTNLST
jgi:hypothetical protein